MLNVISVIRANPDAISETRKALRDLAGHTRQEDGCHRWTILQSDGDPQQFVILEEWETEGDHDAHLRSRHVSEAITALGPLVDSPPARTSYTEVSASDLQVH